MKPFGRLLHTAVLLVIYPGSHQKNLGLPGVLAGCQFTVQHFRILRTAVNQGLVKQILNFDLAVLQITDRPALHGNQGIGFLHTAGNVLQPCAGTADSNAEFLLPDHLGYDFVQGLVSLPLSGNTVDDDAVIVLDAEHIS